MTRIADKSRSVKREKKKKPSQTGSSQRTKTPPRYTIRKDSLDRRYAIDKRTGKRVPVLKADQERARRRKIVVPVFRGITPKKAAKAKSTHKKRSQASKKGWETRRARAKEIAKVQPAVIFGPSGPFIPKEKPPPFADLGPLGPLIPKGMKMHIVGGAADRAEIYPNVKRAADFAWINLQVEAFAQDRAIHEGREPSPIITPRFDRLYGEGHGAFVRFNYYARARDLADIDQMIETLAEDGDYDYAARELYTLYFSPEVA